MRIDRVDINVDGENYRKEIVSATTEALYVAMSGSLTETKSRKPRVIVLGKFQWGGIVYSSEILAQKIILLPNIAAVLQRLKESCVVLASNFPERWIIGRETQNTRVAAPNPDLSSQDLRKENFSYADLQGGNFKGSNLGGVDFSYASLQECLVDKHTRFFRTKFTGARLNNVVFDGSLLTSLCFGQSSLCDASFIRADLRNSNFYGATGRGVCFDHADLRKVDFTRCHLWASSFKGARLDGADFRDGDFLESNFRYASLRGVRYNGKTRLPPTLKPKQRGMKFVNDKNCRC